MHKSRLAGFIIDCKEGTSAAPLDQAANFWSQALGMKTLGRGEPSSSGDLYQRLDATARDLDIEVQRVDHESRLHLDIATDNIPAEVARLEALGAKKIKEVGTWIVMEAPTGHRFCVVRAKGLTNAAGTNEWK